MRKVVLALILLCIAGLAGLLLSSRTTIAPTLIQKEEVVNKKVVKPKYFSYVTNSEASFSSLKKNADNLDGIYVQAGNLSANGNFNVNSVAKQKEILTWVDSQTGLSVYAWVNNYSGRWQGEGIDRMLDNPETTINALSNFVEEYGYEGLSLDFESLPDSAYSKLPAFLSELNRKLDEKNKTLSIHFYIDDRKVEYSKMAAAVDQVIVMAYDEHDSTTGPGPVASVPWIDEGLKRITASVSSEKLILGLGNYGYDWVGGKAKSISISTALNTNAKVEFDQQKGNAWYSYVDLEGKGHEVWFLDKRSVQASTQATSELNLFGYALFRLGSEDPKVWDIFRK